MVVNHGFHKNMKQQKLDNNEKWFLNTKAAY